MQFFFLGTGSCFVIIEGFSAFGNVLRGFLVVAVVQGFLCSGLFWQFMSLLEELEEKESLSLGVRQQKTKCKAEIEKNVMQWQRGQLYSRAHRCQKNWDQKQRQQLVSDFSLALSQLWRVQLIGEYRLLVKTGHPEAKVRKEAKGG